MKLSKKIKIWSLVAVVIFGIGGIAYGVAYHTGAEAKIEKSVVSTYDKVEDGVVSTAQKVQDHFTGDTESNNK